MEYFIFLLSPIVLLITVPPHAGRYAILVTTIITVCVITSLWKLSLEPIYNGEPIWWLDIFFELLLIPSLYSIIVHVWKPHANEFKYSKWFTLGPLTFVASLLAYSLIIKLLALFALTITILLLSVNYYNSRVSLQIL